MTPADAPPRHLIERDVRVAQIATTQNSTQPLVRSAQARQIKLHALGADWFPGAVRRISALTTLAANWDSYGADAIEADLALDAVTFLLSAALPDVPEPAIVPMSDGGIQLEWHLSGMDLEIAFSDIEAGTYFRDTSGQEHEDGLPAAHAALRQFVSGLTTSPTA